MDSKGEYQPVQGRRDDLERSDYRTPSPRSDRSKKILVLGLIASLALNSLFFVRFFSTTPSSSIAVSAIHRVTGDSITGFSKIPKVPRKNSYFAEPYVDKNHTVSDAAWDAIELGHGVVRLNREYALENGLAPSRAWKPDRSEAVYALAAYHSLHCVALVRRFLRDYVRDRKEPGEHTWSHAWHCMETLREEIMCTADGTIQSLPLDPSDRSKALLAGHGEVRQCANWEYLRDWATDHSAGWASAETNGGLAQFGSHYPDGDGIVISPAES